LFVNTASQPVEISGTGFLNNSATNHGGGMYLNAVAVTLDGVTFTGNTSTSVGGGIRNGGTLTVTDSSFSGNHGSSGGGIANFGTLDLQGVQMSGNTVVVASGWGAAVFAQGAVTVNGGTFENHAARHGGAFYVDGTTLTTDGAQILSNSATNRGGGVYFNGTLTGSYIHGSCLTGNTASDGNAVYSAVSTLDATGNWWGAGGASGQVNNRVNASNPLSDCTPQMQQMASSLAMQQSSTVTTVSLPYLDTFESALNWSRSGTWSREAVGGYTEAGWVADATLRNMESVLESRVAFSIPRNRDAVVRFWQMGNLSAEDRVLLEVLPQGSQNWVVVDEQSGLQSGWAERSVVLTGYRNQAVRLRWRVISGSEDSVGIEYRLDELRLETQR
jgi:predicted outer membrane repeat protein